MPDLRFDESTHTYYLDGSRLPSVTQVLEDVRISDYSEIPQDVREAALERGRIVHLATQYDDLGILDESTIDPRILGYIGAWRRFRADTGFVPDLVEHRGYSLAYRYAGTLDRLGKWPGRHGRHLVDIKTGTAPWWVRIQTAAYAAFLDAPMAIARYAVELHEDSTYSVTAAGRNWHEDFNVFLSALNIWHTKRANGVHEERIAA